MGVGSNLKQVLAEKRMSIKDLAIKAHVPVNTLYSITQRDSKRVQGDILQKIAEALNVSTDVLIYGSEVDRDYEMVCDTLRDAGITIVPAGCGDGTGPDGDAFYIWRDDVEVPEDGKIELSFRQLYQIVTGIQQDAAEYKNRYIRQRLETELFLPK